MAARSPRKAARYGPASPGASAIARVTPAAGLDTPIHLVMRSPAPDLRATFGALTPADHGGASASDVPATQVPMNYWLTTHWPPRPGDVFPMASHVHLPLGRETDGRDLRVGDRVVVYQSKDGPTRRRINPAGQIVDEACVAGRGGVLALCEVTGPLQRDADSVPEEYTDGHAIHWAFRAPLEVLSMSGDLPRERLNPLLGYSPKYMLRGVGSKRSGLLRITEAQFEAIADAFLAGRPAVAAAPSPHPGHGGAGEGEPHRRLKEYVAYAPEAALGESGIRLLGIEHKFDTNDCADVALLDRFARVVGVEIEVDVGDGQLVGLLQALKYAVMLAPVYDRHPNDRRAVLVAYSIAARMRALCDVYGVECVTIRRAVVDAWHLERGAKHAHVAPATSLDGAMATSIATAS